MRSGVTGTLTVVDMMTSNKKFSAGEPAGIIAEWALSLLLFVLGPAWGASGKQLLCHLDIELDRLQQFLLGQTLMRRVRLMNRTGPPQQRLTPSAQLRYIGGELGDHDL